MSVFEDIDYALKRGIKLLHSSHPSSATELREMIDEMINQQYGAEKMICNTLTQKQLEEELNFPGRAITPPPLRALEQCSETEVINLTNSPTKTITDSPDTIMDSEEGGVLATGTLLASNEDDGNLKEFGDLNCCVCGEMMFTATNRLCECSMCGALYHQGCHKPPISDEEASEGQDNHWQCNSCNKPTTSKASSILLIPNEPIPLVPKIKSSSRSSSSSNSSSPFYKQEQSIASSRTHHHHKSSSSSSSSKAVLTPAINVISADEKRSSSSSSKKSSHTSSSKSSSKSKHHDSSSSKRKSSKQSSLKNV